MLLRTLLASLHLCQESWIYIYIYKKTKRKNNRKICREKKNYNMSFVSEYMHLMTKKKTGSKQERGAVSQSLFFEAYSIHTGSLLRFFTVQWSSATTDENKRDIDMIGKAKERHARSMQ